jgi:hypothetical protein
MRQLKRFGHRSHIFKPSGFDGQREVQQDWKGRCEARRALVRADLAMSPYLGASRYSGLQPEIRDCPAKDQRSFFNKP